MSVMTRSATGILEETQKKLGMSFEGRPVQWSKELDFTGAWFCYDASSGFMTR